MNMKWLMTVVFVAGIKMGANAGTWANWISQSSGGRFDDAANWSSKAVPVTGDTGSFQDGGTYTITFPAGGYDNASSFYLRKNNAGKTVFDTRGTWWRMPISTNANGSTTYQSEPFSCGNSSGHNFNLEIYWRSGSYGLMMLSNALFSVETVGNVQTTRLDQGYFDLFDPSGVVPSGRKPGHSFIVGTASDNVSIFGPGTHTRFPLFIFKAEGSNKNLMRFEGGVHEFLDSANFYAYSFANVYGRITAEFEAANDAKVIFADIVHINQGNLINTNKTVILRAMDGGTLSFTGSASIEASTGRNRIEVSNGGLFDCGSRAFYLGRGSYSTNEIVLNNGIYRTTAMTRCSEVPTSATSFAATNSVVTLQYTEGGYSGPAAFSFCDSVWSNTAAVYIGHKAPCSLAVKGGKSVTLQNFYFGMDPPSVGTGLFDGGEHSFKGDLSMGWGEGSTGIVRMVDGTVNVGYALRVGGYNGVGTFTLEGGKLTTVNETKIATDNAAAIGHLNLLGGVLRTKAVMGGSGASTFTANGGTLQASGATTTFLHDLGKAELRENGLTLDSDFAVTVSQNFVDAQGAAGKLVKTGKGTLTLTGTDSSPAQTFVADGTLLFGVGAKDNSAISVTNGATLSLAGDCTGMTFLSLSLGDAATRGILAMDLSDQIILTQAGGLALTNALLTLAGSPTNGVYPLIVCTGEASAETAAVWRDMPIAREVGKRYTFSSMYSSTENTTTFSLTIADVSATTGTTVWQGSGTAWNEGANWAGGAAPTAADTAVFSSETAPADIAVGEGAEAGELAFSAAQAYTLSGAAALTLAESVTGAVTVAQGNPVINVPLTLKTPLPVTVAENSTITFAKPLTVGGLSKRGLGKATLTGANQLPSGLAVEDGCLDISAPEAVSANTVKLKGGTLLYRGVSAPVKGAWKVDTGAEGKATVLKNDTDLTLEDGLTSVSGAFLKRGAGTLTIKTNPGDALSSGNGLSNPNMPPNSGDVVVFADNGTAPTKGFDGFNVAEGELRIVNANPTATTYIENTLSVGLHTEKAGTVQPKLVLDGGYFQLNTAAKHVHVGMNVAPNSTMTNPVLEIINGAYASMDTLYMGQGSTGPCWPVAIVSNATLYARWCIHFAFQPNGGISTFRAWNAKVYSQTEPFWQFAADLCFDNSLFARTESSPISIFTVYPTASGAMTFRNGSTLWAAQLNIQSTTQTGIAFLFDNATYRSTTNQRLLFRSAQKNKFQVLPGGLTFDVAAGTTASVSQPVTGTGTLTKTGDGTLLFDAAQTISNDGTATNALEDATTLAIAGKTLVTAGTLAVTNGAATNAVITLASGTGLSLCGGEVQLGEIGGSGIVTNGMLVKSAVLAETNASPTLSGIALKNLTYRYPVAADGSLGTRLVFDNCTFASGVTVDFCRTTANPLKTPFSGAIATYTGAAPDVSTWKVRGAGKGNVTGTFTAKNGVISLKARQGGFVVMLM